MFAWKSLVKIGFVALFVITLYRQYASFNSHVNYRLKKHYRSEEHNRSVKHVTTNPKKKFIILDWCPAFFSKENGQPVNAFFDNCLVTRNRLLLSSSDAVVVDVRRLGNNLKYMPQIRSPWQRWVYFNIESPFHAILDPVSYKMRDFRGKYAFNWTMTYRTDADVPMLHGWTVNKCEIERKETNIDGIVRNKTKLVAALISNCNYVKNGRGQYVKELQR